MYIIELVSPDTWVVLKMKSIFRVSSSQVIFVVATIAGCISVITNMSFGGPSISTG